MILNTSCEKAVCIHIPMKEIRLERYSKNINKNYLRLHILFLLVFSYVFIVSNRSIYYIYTQDTCNHISYHIINGILTVCKTILTLFFEFQK